MDMPRPGVLLAGAAVVGLGALWWAQRRHAAALASSAPAWQRSANQPPDDAVYALPPAWAPVQPVAPGAETPSLRDRWWPDTWVPLTGGPHPAWAWAGAPEDTP